MEVNGNVIFQVIQAGGVLGFAYLVYLELKQLRPVLRSLDLAVQALLERERSRTGPIRRITETEINIIEDKTK